MDDDYLPVNWFSYQQLDMAARWLGREFGEGTNIRIVYLTQERMRRNDHNLMMGWPTYDDTARVIFIHHTPGNTRDGFEDHFQAIVPNPVGNVEAETGVARCDNQTGPSKSASRAPNKRDYVKHGANIPRGDRLLYINGQLGKNRVTGVFGRIGTPLQTMEMQRRLNIRTSGILAHAAKKARDRYSGVSWPAPGVRHSKAPTKSDDLATKLQQRLYSASRDPSRSASPLPKPKPTRNASSEAQPQANSERRSPGSMGVPIEQKTDGNSGAAQPIAGLTPVLDTGNEWRTDQQIQPYQSWTHAVPMYPYPSLHVVTNEPGLADLCPENLLEDHIANVRQHWLIAQEPSAIPGDAGDRDVKHRSNVPSQTGEVRGGPRRSERISAQPRATSPVLSKSRRKRKAESEDEEDEVVAPTTTSKRRRTSTSVLDHESLSGSRRQTPVTTNERTRVFAAYPQQEQPQFGIDPSLEPQLVPSPMLDAHANTVFGGRLWSRSRGSSIESAASDASLSPPSRRQRSNEPTNDEGGTGGSNFETQATADQSVETQDEFADLFEQDEVGTTEDATEYPALWAQDSGCIYEDDGGPGRAPRSSEQQNVGAVEDAADNEPAWEPGRYYTFEAVKGHGRPPRLSEPQRRSRSEDSVEGCPREAPASQLGPQLEVHDDYVTVEGNAGGNSEPDQSVDEEIRLRRLAKAKVESCNHVNCEWLISACKDPRLLTSPPSIVAL